MRIPVKTQEPVRTWELPSSPATAKRISPVEPIAYNTITWVGPPDGRVWDDVMAYVELQASAVAGTRYIALYYMDAQGRIATYNAVDSAAGFVNRHFAAFGSSSVRTSALEAISTGPLWVKQLAFPCRLGVRFHGFDDAGDVRHFYVYVEEVNV